MAGIAEFVREIRTQKDLIGAVFMLENTDKELNKVKEHWEDSKTVSLKDGNLQELERFSILEALKRIGKVNKLADIGCGDGIDTICWRQYAQKVHGYDYSTVMLKKARKLSKGKVKFHSLDILSEMPKEKYDVIVTKRCLINLGTFENQKKAVMKICRNLNPGGHYIMLESCSEGLNNLNIMRLKANLQPLKVPFHNKYFDLGELIAFLKPAFDIEETKNFSTYYFLTRVYNQVLDKDKFAPFDKVAKNFHIDFNLFGSTIIGPQFLMDLKKL